MTILIVCATCGKEHSFDSDDPTLTGADETVCLNCSAPLAMGERGRGEGPAGPAPDALQEETACGESDSLLDRLHDRLTSGDVELSTIPLAAQIILSELQNPTCSLQDLEEMIQCDPVIASKVIQMANSSFYRGISDVETLNAAIMRLGFGEVRNITITVSMKHLRENSRGRFAGRLEQLWKHALVSAFSCREIAKAAHYTRPDEAYLAGLVHDLGTVFILEFLEQASATDERVRALQEKMVDELITILHEEAGARLLEKWMFPQPITSAVRYHHRPGEASDDDLLPQILAASDLLIEKTGAHGCEPDSDLLLSSCMPFQALRIKDLEIAKLVVDLEKGAQEVLRIWN